MLYNIWDLCYNVDYPKKLRQGSLKESGVFFFYVWDAYNSKRSKLIKIEINTEVLH